MVGSYHSVIPQVKGKKACCWMSGLVSDGAKESPS